MWSPSLFFISNRIYRTLNNVGPLNDHIIMEIPCNCGVFAISENTKLYLGLYNVNEWRREHRSHILARFGRNCVCHVTYLPICRSHRWRDHGSNFLTAVTYSSKSNLELYVVKNYLRTEPPSRTCPVLWCYCRHITGEAGPRLNIKTVLSTYGDFHVKDKTAVRTSYL